MQVVSLPFCLLKKYHVNVYQEKKQLLLSFFLFFLRKKQVVFFLLFLLKKNHSFSSSSSHIWEMRCRCLGSIIGLFSLLLPLAGFIGMHHRPLPKKKTFLSIFLLKGFFLFLKQYTMPVAFAPSYFLKL